MKTFEIDVKVREWEEGVPILYIEFPDFLTCHHCGAFVRSDFQDQHGDWHRKHGDY